MRRVLVIATMLAVLFAGCGRKKRVRVAPPPAPAPTVTAGSTKEGIASWYGHPYHGRAAGPALFAVQVGAFRDKSNAERLRHEMEVKYGAARLVLRPGDPPLWRVLVGSEPTQAGAGSLRERIKSDGGSNGAAFVVRVDS